jgi:hypothetical protein
MVTISSSIAQTIPCIARVIAIPVIIFNAPANNFALVAAKLIEEAELYIEFDKPSIDACPLSVEFKYVTTESSKPPKLSDKSSTETEVLLKALIAPLRVVLSSSSNVVFTEFNSLF